MNPPLVLIYLRSLKMWKYFCDCWWFSIMCIFFFKSVFCSKMINWFKRYYWLVKLRTHIVGATAVTANREHRKNVGLISLTCSSTRRRRREITDLSLLSYSSISIELQLCLYWVTALSLLSYSSTSIELQLYFYWVTAVPLLSYSSTSIELQLYLYWVTALPLLSCSSTSIELQLYLYWVTALPILSYSSISIELQLYH